VQLPHVQCLEDFASPCEVWPSCPVGYGRIFTEGLESTPVCKATAPELEELELELESPPACEIWPGPSGYGKIDGVGNWIAGCTTGGATVPNDDTSCGACNCAWWPLDDSM